MKAERVRIAQAASETSGEAKECRANEASISHARIHIHIHIQTQTQTQIRVQSHIKINSFPKASMAAIKRIISEAPSSPSGNSQPRQTHHFAKQLIHQPRAGICKVIAEPKTEQSAVRHGHQKNISQ